MKYCILFLVVLIYIDCSNAKEDICNDKTFSDFTQISAPNCYRSDLINPAREHHLEPLCESCKKEFEAKSITKVGSFSSEDKKQILIKTALKEYKKVLIDNLINVVKLRPVNSTGTSFTKSKNACKLDKEIPEVKNCKSEYGKKILSNDSFFKDISNDASRELARILSNDPNFKSEPTLLKRSKQQCFIREYDIISSLNSTLEESFSPLMIQKIKLMNPSQFSSIDEFILAIGEYYEGDLSEIETAIKSHPLLSIQFADPKRAIDFFKSIPSPDDTYAFKKTLYNEKNGLEFDNKLSNICANSTKELIKTICEENDADLLNLDFKNLDRFSDYGINDEKKYADSEEILDANKFLLKLCQNSLPSNSSSLANKLNPIGTSLLPEYKESSVEKFQRQKFDNEIGQLQNFICDNSSNSKCKSAKSLNCKVLNKVLYPDANINPLERKIASSSNREVDELLKSMIGNPQNLDSQTKSILISNGILPKPDGSIVAQPDVPERKPAQYAAAVQKQQSSQVRTASSLSPVSSSQSNQAMRQGSPESNDDYAPSATSLGSSSSAQTSTSEMFDTIKKQEKELSDVQEEIKRRLSQKPNKKPSSLKEAKEIATDSFKARGRSYTPEQVDSYAQEMMSPRSQQIAAAAQQFPESNQDQSVTSAGESKAEKFKKEQTNRALMGMAGAQQSALNDNKNSTAPETASKVLTKVALHISEDPKVNLSETFNNKLDPNDPETKVIKDLLKKQSNFLLQLKSINFKVVFTEKNAFEVVFESGDKNEAERIRPQLEMFLNKIKRNNTLHNLSQSWST